MPATIAAAITTLEMICLREYHQAILYVKVRLFTLWLVLMFFLFHYLNTMSVGLIPAAKEFFREPSVP